MAFTTLSVNGTSPADTLVSAGDGPTLIGNADTTTTLWLGQNNAITAGRFIDAIPLTPQGWVVVDGKEDVFGITNGPAINVFLIPGGLAFFQEFVGSGATIFVQGTPPTANAIGDLWYDNSNGMLLHQWNGVAWVPFTIGTAAIAPGSITAPLIAANTITAAQIAAHTITTTELITGMIYAGIVDATTINAATFTGSTFRGTNFIINSSGMFFYNGTPATGNLILSIAPANGTDAFGNTFQQGFTCADPAILLFPSLQTFENQKALINSSASPPAVNQFLQLLIQGPSTTTVGARDSVALELNSASKDNSSNANMPFIYNGSAGGAHEYAFLDATGFNVVAGMNDPPDPSTLPGAVTIENWHNFTLSTGTAGTDTNGALYNPQYKLYSDGHIGLKGVYVAPAAGLASGATWAVIPNFPQYRPTANIPTALVSNAAHGTLVHVYIRPNGNVQFNGALGATVSILLDCVLNMRLQ